MTQPTTQPNTGDGSPLPRPTGSRRLWERAPEHDRRISRGDDFAGDAWRHFWTGSIRWYVVGKKPSDNPPLHSANDQGEARRK